VSKYSIIKEKEGDKMLKVKANGLKIAETRIRMGLLGSDLAKAIGVTKQTIYTIERGEINPGPAVAKAISEKLGVTFDELFTIEEGE